MIINKTGYSVEILDDTGKVIHTFPTEGSVTLSEVSDLVGHATYNDDNDMQGVPVYDRGNIVVELIPKLDNTVYLVTPDVQRACPQRKDFLVPDNTKIIDGTTIRCQSFIRGRRY